jgi:DNA replication protein DnaC
MEVAGRVIHLSPAKYCSKDACVAIAEAERAKEFHVHMPSNTDGCPELFKDTDPKRLPPVLAALATTWHPETQKKSLLIHGVTRKGKTRCMWFIRNRLKGLGISMKVMTMFELEADMAAAWGKERWDQAMKALIEAEVLGLDDLGKEKMTERMASVLFAIIDQRAQHKRATVITTNHTGASLAERFHDKEVGNALLARIKDKDLFSVVGVAPGAETPEML